MSEDLIQLSKVAPPPTDPAPPPDWSAVSAELGTALPGDYRELIETYGGGLFDEYLYVLEPSSSNSAYDLVTWQRERTEGLELMWADGEPRPAELDGGARLIVWAATDYGDCVYWLAEPGASPDGWTVMVEQGHGPGWEHFPMGAVAFLAGTLTGDVRSELLAVEDPVETHGFRPLTSF